MHLMEGVTLRMHHASYGGCHSEDAPCILWKVSLGGCTMHLMEGVTLRMHHASYGGCHSEDAPCILWKVSL